MFKYKAKGYTIEIKLSGKYKSKGYSVECTYKFDKTKEKYLLSMWLKKDNIDNKFKIDSQGIDTQYINGTKETIRQNICRIVDQASSSGYFDYYIQRYEYTMKCFDKGDEYFEKERIGD